MKPKKKQNKKDDPEMSKFYYIYTSPFEKATELKTLFYKAITNSIITSNIDKCVFINLEPVNLIKCLLEKKLILKFRLFMNLDEVNQTKKNITAWLLNKKTSSDAELKSLFDDIKCTSVKMYPNIKIKPCERGKSLYKLFYDGARDLKHYIQKMNNQEIDISHHNMIFDIIATWSCFRNHNLDLPILHFK